MKLACFLLFLPGTVGAQSVIFAEFKTESIVWSEPTSLSKAIATVQPGDSCIVLHYLKPSVGAEWVKILTPDTIGYAMISYLNFPVGALYELMNEKDYSHRLGPAIDFANKYRPEWAARQKQRHEDILKSKEGKLREEMANLQNRTDSMEMMVARIRSQFEKFTLLVQSYSFSSNKDGSFLDFYVQVLNCNAKRTIKYLWFNVTVYNSVNDPEGSKNLQGIGPIKPFDQGVYNFENFIYSNVVDYGKINSVKIQYMDGTTVILTGKQLDANLKKANAILDK